MTFFRWAVGVTTVPVRRDKLLPATLASLRAAGWPDFRLFVDGASSGFEGLGATEGVTYREPALRPFGNWVLGLAELLIRNPAANRFMMCQDDVLFCRNVKDYLDRCKFPDGGSDKTPYHRGWWNLYTAPKEEQRLQGERRWCLSSQTFQGALALVFDRETVLQLLHNRITVERPLDPSRGWRNIDGGVGDALGRGLGFKELVHLPSLAQHAGWEETTVQRNYALDRRSETWETGFDAMSLLPAN